MDGFWMCTQHPNTWLGFSMWLPAYPIQLWEDYWVIAVTLRILYDQVVIFLWKTMMMFLWNTVTGTSNMRYSNANFLSVLYVL